VQSTRDSPASPRKRAKLSFNEVRELDALPAALEALEKEQAELAAKLADPATYTSGTADPRKLNERHEAIDAELTRLLARWEELEAKKTAAG
jgi:ATP-binding cassette subfamily F protein uup